jgi:hypothetical protein
MSLHKIRPLTVSDLTARADTKSLLQKHPSYGAKQWIRVAQMMIRRGDEVTTTKTNERKGNWATSTPHLSISYKLYL